MSYLAKSGSCRANGGHEGKRKWWERGGGREGEGWRGGGRGGEREEGMTMGSIGLLRARPRCRGEVYRCGALKDGC